MDDETKADLGKALGDAIKAGDGAAIVDAFEALQRCCGGEPDEDDMGEEDGGKAPSALVLALGKKGK